MKKIVVIVLAIVILGATIWFGGTKLINRSHTSLSQDTVSQMITEKYGGTIKKISPDEENYKLTLEKDQNIYDVTVSRKTGEVTSFVQQTSKVMNNSGQQKQTETQTSNLPTSTPITIDKAGKLAQQKVTGTITSIELDEENGQLVYEVEIRQSKTKQAEVIINAYSGKIESISYETIEKD